MTRRIRLDIQGMECPNCSLALERIEENVSGVLKAEASYRKGQMVVEYNEEQLTEAQIIDEVAQMGFQVTSVVAF